MCKYEMDPTSIVEDRERSMILSTDSRTDGRTDSRTDNVKPVYPPFNFVEARGYNDSNSDRGISWYKQNAIRIMAAMNLETCLGDWLRQTSSLHHSYIDGLVQDCTDKYKDVILPV